MPLMECIILDLYNAQLPEHKAWFKETREERFGTSLEKASTQSVTLASTLSFKEFHMRLSIIDRHHSGPATANAIAVMVQRVCTELPLLPQIVA